MLSGLWDKFSLWVMHLGMPLVAVYHLVCANPFLNVSASDAKGFEKMGNILLLPVQYLLAGKEGAPIYEDGKVIRYQFEQKFSYDDPALWWKTAACCCALPPSIVLGSACKGIGYLLADSNRLAVLAKSVKSGGKNFHSHLEEYVSMGIQLVPFSQAEKIVHQGYERRPGDEKNLSIEKKALQEIINLLIAHEIPHWLDCGTCLGAYRYGGSIPWDWDIDLAVLQPDFDNVLYALSKLDPSKYVVQDWSSRDKPKTYLKVYVKENAAIIDIYHFSINPNTQEIRSILSNEGSVFLPESWKIRERRYTIPTHFSLVFPLKKGIFDGVEAFMPRETEAYLQQRYGKNISPVKIYSAKDGGYVKDLSHPYWQDAHTR